MGGDFNSVVNKYEDKSSLHPSLGAPPSSTEQPTTLLATTMSLLHLSDIWHLTHPTNREYTFYSSPHDTLSRIDYFFCSSALILKVQDSIISAMAISDQALQRQFWTISNPTITPPPRRFPSYSADNEDFQHNRTWNDYVFTNAEHVSNPNLFWETGKAVIQGVIISYTT